MKLNRNFAKTIMLSTALAGVLVGCRPDNESVGPEDGADEVQRESARAVLTFPPDLMVADATVNEFVAEAMRTCAKGDYDSFRLLWSAREELITKNEYERGWKAVQRIDIRAVEEVELAPDSDRGETEPRTVYAVLAHVAFDPTQTADRQDIERHVVLVVQRVHDEWRLGRAPRGLRTWLTEKAKPGPAKTEQSAHKRTTG